MKYVTDMNARERASFKDAYANIADCVALITKALEEEDDGELFGATVTFAMLATAATNQLLEILKSGVFTEVPDFPPAASGEAV